MKRLLVILGLVMVMSGAGMAQKIQCKGSGEIKELKDCVVKYFAVSIDAGGLYYDMRINIGTTKDVWVFYDESTGKPLKLKSAVELMNYLYTNGWIFKDTMSEEEKGGQYYYYLFEKME